MASANDKPSLSIIDRRGLRRAWLANYLKAWADARDLDIVAVDPAQVLEVIGNLSDCRMVVLSSGADHLDEPHLRKWVRAVRNLVRDAPLIIITDLDESEQVVEALRLGATGFVPTSLDPEFVLQAFSFILDGGMYFPPAIFRRLSWQEIFARASPEGHGGGGRQHDTATAESDQDDDDPIKGAGLSGDALTARQREVFALLQLGKPNKLIARQLSMTEATVKLHVRQILRKLGAANRTEAALSAYQRKSSAEAHEQSMVDCAAGEFN